MAQSIEQINQSLRALESQANEFGERLYAAYQGYRTGVGQAALQQLTMACFTLCTEAYPEEFLGLEVYQRHQLQTQIRQVVKQLQTNLIEQLPHPQAPIVADPPPDKPLTHASTLPFSRLLEAHRLETPTREQPAADTAPEPGLGESDVIDDVIDDVIAPEHARARSIEAEVNSIEEELRALLSLEALIPAAAKSSQPKTPIEQLLRWQDQVEETTIALIRQTSRELNISFQKAGLIPAQIPAPILEAAAHTDGGDPFGKAPHLLRMVLEAREIHRDDSDRKPGDDSAAKRRRRDEKRPTQPPTIVPIVAVQMRLVELEFNDTNLITWRNQIRDLSKQLKSLAKDYQKKQREQAVANARLAWQSTWTDD